MVEDATDFRPRLDSYSGPLDFLLFLIKKNEIDIFDIPVAAVIDQYRLYLDLIKEIDPGACGEFLVLCAQLMEIKSKMLLPRAVLEEGEEEFDDPRLELVQQLLEFKKYKERSMLLESRFEEFRRRYRRPHVPVAESGIDYSGPVFLGNLSVWDLLTTFQRIQSSLGDRGPHRVQLHDRPLTEYIGMVQTVLKGGPRGGVPFERLFEGVTDRLDAIGLLLAVLEMAKGYRLAILREGDAEEDGITVRLRTPEERAQFRQWIQEEGSSGDADPVEALLLEGEGEEARAEPIEIEDAASSDVDAEATIASDTAEGASDTAEGRAVRDDEDAPS